MPRRRAIAALSVLALAAGATTTVAWITVDSHRSPAAGPGAGAAAASAPAAVGDGPTDVFVNGAKVPTTGPTTVAQALAASGQRATPGHYLAVVSQRWLGSDRQPARILVDGRPATLATLLPPDATLIVRPGRDEVEPTEAVTLPLAPAVPSALYVGGRPGVVRVVRGRLSHEVISRRVLRRPVVGHLIRPGAVALTFDDGPADLWTRRILNLLDARHVPATFCMIGRQVPGREWLVRRVVRSGDALCDHTWDHDLQLRLRPAGQMQLDIVRAQRAITRASGGVAPAFFRAPGGNWSPALMHLARQDGMTPLTWTVDPRDWTRPGVKSILHTVYAELRPGGVILMHDGGGNRAQTFAALRILLHRLPKLGYHFVLPPAPAAQQPPHPSQSPSAAPTSASPSPSP